MEKVVIDTNCLVQIISKHCPFRPIWDAFMERKYHLCISNEILEEYQELLEKKTTSIIAEKLILLILNKSNVSFIEPHFRLNLIAEDPDDNKFVDCAFAANADYLISNDAHFRILNSIQFPHLNLLTMEQFMKHLK